MPRAWLVLLALVLALALFTDLAPDAAYYAAWSDQPRLSYLDHPGGVAWALIGWKSVGVWLLPLLVFGAQIPLAFLVLKHSGRALVENQNLKVDKSNQSVSKTDVHNTQRFLILLAASPLSLAASCIWTPDAPLLVGWHVALLGGLLLVRGGFGGVFLLMGGVCLMSVAKVVAPVLAVILGVSLYVARAGTARWSALAVGVSVLISFGVGFDSWGFQGLRLQHVWRWWRPLAGVGEVVGGFLLLAGPGLVWVGLRLGAILKARPVHRCFTAAGGVERFLVLSGGGVLGFWMAVGCVTHVEANWLAPAVLPLAVWALGRGGMPRRGWFWGQMLAAVLLVVQAVWVVVPLGRHDPTRHLRGWQAWGLSLPADGVGLVLADRYQWAVEAAWYAPAHPKPATWDVMGPGLARRPSALDRAVEPRLHARVLILSGERPIPIKNIGIYWPYRCVSSRVESPLGAGPMPVMVAEVWAVSAAECP